MVGKNGTDWAEERKPTVIPVANFNRMASMDCIKKVRFQQKLDEGESISQTDIWRRYLNSGKIWCGCCKKVWGMTSATVAGED